MLPPTVNKPVVVFINGAPVGNTPAQTICHVPPGISACIVAVSPADKQCGPDIVAWEGASRMVIVCESDALPQALVNVQVTVVVPALIPDIDP